MNKELKKQCHKIVKMIKQNNLLHNKCSLDGMHAIFIRGEQTDPDNPDNYQISYELIGDSDVCFDMISMENARPFEATEWEGTFEMDMSHYLDSSTKFTKRSEFDTELFASHLFLEIAECLELSDIANATTNKIHHILLFGDMFKNGDSLILDVAKYCFTAPYIGRLLTKSLADRLTENMKSK